MIGGAVTRAERQAEEIDGAPMMGMRPPATRAAGERR